MRTTTRCILVCTVFAFGCDWRVFDDLAEETWVRADGPPADLGGEGFGSGLQCTSESADELSYVVASQAPASLTRVTFSASGKRSTITLQVRDTIAFAEALSEPVALAIDPEGLGQAQGNVALGVYDGESSFIYLFKADTFIATAPIDLGALGAAPSGIAFGASDAGEAGERDICAGIGTSLVCRPDYQSATENVACELGAQASDVLLANLDTSSDADEVLVAAGGEVRVYNGSQIVDCATTPPTPLATITAPDGESDFGAHMALLDFNGSGGLDLVVAAPATNAAYVYYDWTVDSMSNPTAIAKPSGAVAFGSAIAVGDVDGDGTDDLAIADPRRSTGSKPSIGTTYLYVGGGSSPGAPIALFDAKSDSNQSYGKSLAICGYGDDNLLIVGAKEEVFTYFRTPIDGDDDAR